MMKRFYNFPFHPFFFVWFPIVFLIQMNPDKLRLSQSPWSFIVLGTLCAVLMGLSWVYYRDWNKTGLFASLVIVLTFAYKSLYAIATDWELSFVHRYLVLWYGITFLIAFFLTKRIKFNLGRVTELLNIVSIGLVAYNLVNILWVTSTFDKPNPPTISSSETFIAPAQKPDVYHFMLDGYARADVLNDLHELDNTPFLTALRLRGFYVCDSSHSNYPSTVASLASVFNMTHLESPASTSKWWEWSEMISDNRVFKLFDNLGYDINTFPNEYEWVSIRNTDHYQSKFYHNELSIALFVMTPLRHIPGSRKMIVPSRRNMILDPYRYIQHMPATNTPKVVYVHSMCPHPPYIFGPNGEEVTQYDKWWDMNWLPGPGYRDQVSFINKLLLSTVDSILAKSKVPPIILVHSDHSCRHGIHGETFETISHREQFSNLCAVYFPQGKADALYPTLSPVNLYPLIFNQYFGAQYKLLSDDSYFFEWEDNTDFRNVTLDIQKEEATIRESQTDSTRLRKHLN